MFEDLLRNAKVHTMFIKSVALKMTARTLVVPAVCRSEEASDDDVEPLPGEQPASAMNQSAIAAKFALRQQYSLLAHVVPANVTDRTPANHGSMKQKLLVYNPSIRCLAEEGRWLAFDQFLLRLEKHFETCVVHRHRKD